MTFRPFTPTDWQDSPATATPIDAASLEHIENALGEIDSDLATAETSVGLNNTHRGTTTGNPHSVPAANLGVKQLLVRSAGNCTLINSTTNIDQELYKAHVTWPGAIEDARVWVDLSMFFTWTNLPTNDLLWLAPALSLNDSGGSDTVLEVPSSSMYFRYDTDAQAISGHVRCFAAALVQRDLSIGGLELGVSVGLRGYFGIDNLGRNGTAIKYAARITEV